MEVSFNVIGTQLLQTLKVALAEPLVLLFLIGLLILFIGLVFIYLQLKPRLLGPSPIKGKVAGAVKHSFSIEAKHQTTTKKNMSFIFPVFEYISTDKTKKMIRGGIAGSHVLKYKTGQVVNLVIHDDLLDDDAYATDTGNLTLLYWGIFIIAIGFLIMVKCVIYLSGLSLSLSALIAIAVSILVKLKLKRKAKKKIALDFSKMRPIEEFVKESKR